MKPQFQLITAHSYSPKFKQYIFAGYILETNHAGLPSDHTFKVLGNYTIDENKGTARAELIERIFKNNLRHDHEKMTETHVGRVSRERAMGFAF